MSELYNDQTWDDSNGKDYKSQCNRSNFIVTLSGVIVPMSGNDS